MWSHIYARVAIFHPTEDSEEVGQIHVCTLSLYIFESNPRLNTLSNVWDHISIVSFVSASIFVWPGSFYTSINTFKCGRNIICVLDIFYCSIFLYVPSLVSIICMLYKPVMPTPPLPTHLVMHYTFEMSFSRDLIVLFKLRTYSVARRQLCSIRIFFSFLYWYRSYSDIKWWIANRWILSSGGVGTRRVCNQSVYHACFYVLSINKDVNTQFFSRPGQSQRLLHKHRCH